MRFGLACLATAMAAIAGVWAWLGAPVAMPHAPLAPGEKLYCVSYAPFHGWQSPLDASAQISAAQIEQDLGELAKITDCVRTYSVDFGLQQIPAIAERHGLQVMLGLWLSREREQNRRQIETGVALANRYPGTVRSVVVGNEVLLRGEMAPGDLAATIRAVKTRVKVPVTYADVWEFWLRHRDVAAAVDFVTIHILPYWEDVPVAAGAAAAHVAAIHDQVVAAFPGKDVLIGEVGWPSAGRMRQGALPSPANQARVIQDVLAVASAKMFHVNVIEAFDQPWKRALEGTVGGHWGLFDDANRRLKFGWGQPVSDHPSWPWQAGGGIVFALIIFGAAFAGRRGAPPSILWLAVTANALAGGILIGWAAENAALESLGLAGWLRSLAYVALALASPPLASMAIMRGQPAPRLSRLLGPKPQRLRDPLAFALGAVMIVTLLLALNAAFGLVFDPRYKDFPFAPLTAAIIPLLTLSFASARRAGARGAAELAAAALLLLSALYIVPHETLANWQSLWFSGVLAGLAVSLWRVRDAPD
jgi:exo-beta-1,3-glucanase (GH17 family)